MSYELHYASLKENNDIPSYKLKSDIELFSFLLAEANEIDCIYLVSINQEEFICDHILKVIKFIDKNFQGNDINKIVKEVLESVNYIEPLIKIFVQEYLSYEEAYKVALSMNEDSPLCYSI